LTIIVPGCVVLGTVEHITNTTIDLTWNEPVENNGVIVNYTIYWVNDSDSSEGNYSVNKTVFTLNDLKPYTNYTLSVFASTRKGQGPENCQGSQTILTLIGGRWILFCFRNIIFMKIILKCIINLCFYC